MNKSLNTWLVGIFAISLSLLTAVQVAAETMVGSNIDSRVVLAFKANDTAVQGKLPEGWGLLTLPGGPLAGSNLLLAFIDRQLALDPDDEPLEPYESRALAVLAYGVNPEVEGARLFVIRVYETPPVASSYENGIAAGISRDSSLIGSADGAKKRQEIWRVEPESGGVLDFKLVYETGRPGWSSSEARPYSAANPEFHRIYRYDQLADLAKSVALGRELNGNVEIRSSIPELAEIFDGTENMTGILAIPVYVRAVFLP